MKINIGKNIENNKSTGLDFNKLVNGRTFVSSMTDGGKSWTIRKICEEIFGKVGLIILDPEGEYITLREKYPFLIIGKDIPLEVDSAEFLAEQVLKENISVIIDFSTTDILDQQEFTSKFINRFMALQTKLKKAYVLVVEETDEFAPEKGTYKSESLRSIINVAKKGRKRGIGLIVATQRPAFVSKFVISQCQNKIIGHTEWTGDLKVIKNFLQVSDEMITKISKLNQGIFLFSGGFIDGDEFTKVGEVKTTHSGQTPIITLPRTRQLKSIINKLSLSLPKIVEEKLKPSIPDTKVVEEKIKLKIEKGSKKKIFELEREIKELHAQQISEEEIQKRIDNAIDEYRGKFQEQDSEIVKLKKFIISIVAKGNQFLKEGGQQIMHEVNPSISSNYDLWLDKFTGGKKQVLDLLIKHKEISRSQLIIMSGLKKTNLTHNILPVLKSAGLITYNNQSATLNE